MSILRGSRYAGIPITGLRTTDGKERKYINDRRIYSIDDVGEDAIEHTIVGGQQLDTLADLYYKDDKLYWLIADVNNILFPLDITPGQIVIVPNPDLVADLGLGT